MQFAYVLDGVPLKPPPDAVWHLPQARLYEGLVEQLQGLGLGPFAYRPEPSPSSRDRIAPLGGDGEDFIVQSGRAVSVQRQPAERHHSGYGVIGANHAGAGELIVQETLRQEASEQTLHHPMLEVEVDHLVVERTRIAEHHRPDGCLSAPLPAFLPLPDGGLAGHRGYAPQVWSAPMRSCRRGMTHRAVDGSRAACASSTGFNDSASRISSEADSASRKWRSSSPNPVPGLSQHLLQALYLGGQRGLALPYLLEVLDHHHLTFRATPNLAIDPVEGVPEVRHLLVANAAGEHRVHPLGDHRGKAAQLFVDDFGLLDQHVEHAILRPLVNHEVVAADLR